jgi:rhodanese-related sulfurtransferase/polyisoprenoid-binding protein YceI
MTLNIEKSRLVSKQLNTLLEEEPGTTLVDLLPPDHFENLHIPGAKNACVFFVSFLDDLAAIVSSKEERVVVYGSSTRSHDARVAVEKMTRAGYQDIYQLEGGLKAWREAGFGCDGESPDRPIEPQNKLSLPDGTFTIDADRSKVEWAGRNPNSCHIGTVDISEGVLNSKGGRFSGTVEVDMNSIHNVNLEGDELQPVLEAHLKSDDFFFTSMFPKAVLQIKEAVPIEPGSETAPNFQVKGELSLRGVSASLDFDTTVSLADNNTLLLEAHFDIDKTRWNVIYGSTRFFEHLGMHKVFDLISLQVNIIAVR